MRRCFIWTILIASLPLAVVADDAVAQSPSASPTTDPSPATAPAPKTAPARWVPNDQRRTLRSYGSNLLYNFLGVVTPGNRMPLLVTTALTAPAFAWDDETIGYFKKHPHENFGKIGANLGGGIAVAGMTVGFFSAGRFSHGDRFRATTYDLSQAIIVNQVWTQILKFSIRRERPDGSNRQAFPSGHASNAFTAAETITRHYPKLAIPGYAVATFIATSRLAANKHHLSDVVAGAGFGYGVGRLVVRRNSRPPEAGAVDTQPKSTRLLQIVPDGGPAGDGRGLALRILF